MLPIYVLLITDKYVEPGTYTCQDCWIIFHFKEKTQSLRKLIKRKHVLKSNGLRTDYWLEISIRQDALARNLASGTSRFSK